VMALMAFCPTGLLGLIQRATKALRRDAAPAPLGIETTEP